MRRRIIRIGGLGYQEVFRRIDDAPPRVDDFGRILRGQVSVCGGPTGGSPMTAACGSITVPLPGGKTIGVTVSPTPQQPGLIPAGTGDRIRTWMQEKSIVAGYENWKVVGAAALAFVFFTRR